MQQEQMVKVGLSGDLGGKVRLRVASGGDIFREFHREKITKLAFLSTVGHL